MGPRLRSMILVMLALGFGFGGCGVRGDEAKPAVETIIPTTADLGFTDAITQSDVAPALAENPEVSSDGILLAAIILATGDIDTALQKGVVSEAEVDAAVVAIETDSLDIYLSGVAGE